MGNDTPAEEPGNAPEEANASVEKDQIRKKPSAGHNSPLPKTGIERKICSYAAFGGGKPDTIVKCPTPQVGQRVMSLPVSFLIKSTAESFTLTVTVAPVSIMHSTSIFFFTAEARNP